MDKAGGVFAKLMKSSEDFVDLDVMAAEMLPCVDNT